MKTSRSLLGALLLACLLISRAFAAAAPAITLAVDATDAPRNLLHVQESIAVAPGSLTLFYPKWIPGEREGTLLWLEVDVTIRHRTGGQKSLDDFCRAFCGGVSGPPALKPYTFADVVAALKGVAPHDWQALLTERLQSLRPTAPMGGIEQGGWRLVFKAEPTSMFKSMEAVFKQLDARHSLGLVLKADGKEDGAVIDVVPGLPAALAGLAPGMKLVAVNGRRYSADVLKDALKAGVGKNAPLVLLAENREFFTTHEVNYRGGMKYPWLERDAAKPDLLTKIFSPLVADQAP
ncbi:MAG: hypothetical protein Q7S40_19015 [Opitutaceae bacterium]|nr:hypothetical protein [Opitutaceae bacterium]